MFRLPKTSEILELAFQDLSEINRRPAPNEDGLFESGMILRVVQHLGLVSKIDHGQIRRELRRWLRDGRYPVAHIEYLMHGFQYPGITPKVDVGSRAPERYHQLKVNLMNEYLTKIVATVLGVWVVGCVMGYLLKSTGSGSGQPAEENLLNHLLKTLVDAIFCGMGYVIGESILRFCFGRFFG